MIIDQVVYACPDCSIEQTQSGPCSACGEPVELARIVRRGVGGRAADPTTARTRALRVRITEREHAAIVEAAGERSVSAWVRDAIRSALGEAP